MVNCLNKKLGKITALVLILAFGSGGAAYAAEKLTLNLKGADIQAVIDTVAELTGKSFIVDPRVKGKVTIISTRKMSPDDVYQMFLSILDVHGFSAVESNDVVKILPDADAKHASTPNRGEGDELVTQVVEVNNIAAAQLVPILRPLVPPQGHLAAHAQTNTLIISDRAANVARLVRIIGRIDQPSSGEIEIIQLQNASATEVVRILTALEQQERKKDPKSASSAPTLVADDRTNSIMVGGDKSDRLQLRAIISHLDTPTETTGNTKVIYLRYAKAKDLVSVLTGVADVSKKGARGGKPAAAASASPIKIQADETTNALVITASQGELKSLEGVIRQLDIRRAQVLVEAVIAEVSSTKAAELGMQWLFDGTPGGEGPVGLINFSGAGGGGILGTAAAISSGQAPGGLDGMAIGVGQFNSPTLNFAGLIRALDSNGTSNVLSTPSLLTLDNQEAEIIVGQQVPFKTGTTAPTGGTSPAIPYTSIKRENIGITLKVKPQINEGNSVQLEIEQTVDSLAPSLDGAADLVTNKRSLKTTVLINDGEMIVLGGLIEENLVESEQKVPWLGDIPLLGWLFATRTTTKVKTNLMVFLQPKIIRDGMTATHYSSGKYNFMRAQQLDVREEGVTLMSDDEAPVLPSLEEWLALPPSFEETDSGKATAKGELDAVDHE